MHMFIGHLPAGYIMTRAIQRKVGAAHYLWLGLVASVLPDSDIFYFYLIDNRQNLHHSYWIHIPFFWLAIALMSFGVMWFLWRQDAAARANALLAATIFFVNVFLHLVLDTIVGKIEWLYPFTDEAYFLFDVAAVYDFWVFNFIFHWTFLFELAVVGWAGWELWRARREYKKQKA